ncbi:CGNR zinc finger domain-containing protein [Streptomyces gelaticus]|uniref:CGNR zinc finger domain-containing protein n=1 Tax=Streptomyces gelaticus TaxID=285446 RepID=UPI003796237B
MKFEHDNMVGVRLAVALVNLEADGSWGVTALERMLQDHAIRRARITDSSCAQIRAWVQRLRPVFEAASQEERCRTINALLADGAGSVYLTTHDGLRPHLHFAPDGEDVQSRVKAVTAGGVAIFTTEAEGQRLGVCALDSCRTAFVDTSRNGRRAYCRARCANTDAVRRHRMKPSGLGSSAGETKGF